MSASSTRPDSVTTRCTRPSPSNRPSPSPPTHSTPCDPSTPAKNSPAVRPKPSDSGSSSCITSVQDLPAAVSEAATSHAMYDPPIKTTREASAASARIASALPSARR